MNNDAQIERLAAVLRDVERSGGRDRWAHLRSHGHSFSTVRSAVVRGYLREWQPHSLEYEWTDDATAFLVWYGERKKAIAAETVTA